MLPLDYLFQIQEDLTLGSYKTIEIFMAQKFGICWNDNKENTNANNLFTNLLFIFHFISPFYSKGIILLPYLLLPR